MFISRLRTSFSWVDWLLHLAAMKAVKFRAWAGGWRLAWESSLTVCMSGMVTGLGN